MIGDWISLFMLLGAVVLGAFGTFCATYILLDIVSGRAEKRIMDKREDTTDDSA